MVHHQHNSVPRASHADSFLAKPSLGNITGSVKQIDRNTGQSSYYFEALQKFRNILDSDGGDVQGSMCNRIT